MPGSSRRIGVLVPEFRNPFSAEVTNGIEWRAGLEGWRVVAVETMQDIARQSTRLATARADGLDGILIVPVLGQVPADEIRDTGLPVVVIGSPVPGDAGSSISPDDEAGARLAVQHLLALGRRRILLAGGPTRSRWASVRLEAARSAVREAEGARLLVLRTEDISIRAGEEAVGRILHMGQRPDALFAANDLVAIGVLQAAARAGIRVPEELAVCGFDDIAAAATQPVPLTTLHQPRERMGATAVELLVEAFAGRPPRSVVVAPDLVVRASTGSPSSVAASPD